MQKKILLVGESWTSTSTHVKGFDQFATATGTPAQRTFWPRSPTVPMPLPICPPTRRRPTFR